MTLNRTAIEWCDVTWNPVTGCLRGCKFCYARNIANRFKKNYAEWFAPKFYPERLQDPYTQKKPKVIFVVSMGDLFDDKVPLPWIESVLESCLSAPWHTYIFLTKNPDKMRLFFQDYAVQKNFWLGTSCGESKESWKRMVPIIEIGGINGWNTFLSVEPLQEQNPNFYLGGIKWVIVGIRTNPLTPCTPEVIGNTIANVRQLCIPLFLKDSVIQCFPEIKPTREFPEGVCLYG